MPSPLEYAYEKLSNAVYYLAIGPGDIRERLRTAGQEVLYIRMDQLPDWPRSELEAIVDALTRRRARDGFDGALAATLFGMRRSTGVSIAKQIFELRYQIGSALERDRR